MQQHANLGYVEHPHVLPPEPMKNSKKNKRINPELIRKAVEISHQAAHIRSQFGQEQNEAVPST